MKWTSKLIDLWNDDIRQRRAIVIRDVLGDDDTFPSGRPYYKDTRLRTLREFKYTEEEINEN
jgi:hypothetical protein